jgi:hypothetical protein
VVTNVVTSGVACALCTFADLLLVLSALAMLLLVLSALAYLTGNLFFSQVVRNLFFLCHFFVVFYCVGILIPFHLVYGV